MDFFGRYPGRHRYYKNSYHAFKIYTYYTDSPIKVKSFLQGMAGTHHASFKNKVHTPEAMNP